MLSFSERQLLDGRIGRLVGATYRVSLLRDILVDHDEDRRRSLVAVDKLLFSYVYKSLIALPSMFLFDQRRGKYNSVSGYTCHFTTRCPTAGR